MGRVSALADKAPQQSFTGGGDGETGGTSRKLSVTSERRRLLTKKRLLCSLLDLLARVREDRKKKESKV